MSLLRLVLEELVDDAKVLSSKVGVLGQETVGLMGLGAERDRSLHVGGGVLGQREVLKGGECGEFVKRGRKDTFVPYLVAVGANE